MLLPCLASVHAATLSVPGDYGSVQAAVNHASDGDTVQIAPGVYVEDLEIEVDVELRGTDVTLQGSHTVEGEVLFAGLRFTGAHDGAPVLDLVDAEVTLSDCEIEDNDAGYGGVAGVRARDTELTLESSRLASNHGFGEVGAILLDGGSLRLDRVSFEGNGSTYGYGDVYAQGAEIDVVDSSFAGSRAYSGAGSLTVVSAEGVHLQGVLFSDTSTTYGSGGALNVQGGSVTLEDVEILAPRAFSSGGAIYVDADEVRIEGLRVDGSSSTYGQGGALYLRALSVRVDLLWVDEAQSETAGALYIEAQTLEMQRSVVRGGLATYGSGSGILLVEELDLHDNDWLDGGELRVQAGTRGRFINSIVTLDGVTLEGVEELGYNAWWGGIEPLLGEGDVLVECSFQAPPDDLHLAEGSACIDAGHPELFDDDGSRSDIGAFSSYQPVDSGFPGDDTGAGPNDSAPTQDTGHPVSGRDQGRGSAVQPFCGCGGGSSALSLLAGLLLLRRRR